VIWCSRGFPDFAPVVISGAVEGNYLCTNDGAPLRADCGMLAEPAAVPQASVEQFINLTTRRLATVLTDRPVHSSQEPKFGVDGFQVAHAAKLVGRSRRASHPEQSPTRRDWR
jgi:hypothetical protein